MLGLRSLGRPLSSLTVVALGVVLSAGCGTDNGADTYTSPVPTTATSTSTPDAGKRPPFDAGTSSGKDAGSTKPDAGVDPGDPDPGDPDPGDPDPPDPQQCVDPDDAGGTEPLAKPLGDTDDNQNHPIVIKGTMNGAVDVDFYKFNVTDSGGNKMDTAFETPTKGVELCVWVSCKKGDINFKGCSGGTEDKSLAGRSGCCASGPGTPTPDWECKGSVVHPVLDDSASVVVRVRQTADACLPYSWSYKF